MFVHPPPGPAHMSGSRSVNPHPSPALCLFRKIEQAQTQRRSSEPAAAHIQGVDPPFPVCAAENSPAHARLTHPHLISKHILQITKCPVTRTVSRTVGPKPRFKKPKLGEKRNGTWVEVGFCRRSLSERSGLVEKYCLFHYISGHFPWARKIKIEV